MREQNTQATPSARPEPFQPRILLVEATEGGRSLLMPAESEAGESLVRVRSGREAVELLSREEFALAIVHSRPPDLDAFEVAGLIRREPQLQELPILLVSAFPPAPADLDRATLLGAVDFMGPPVTPATLRSRLRIFLDLHRGRTTLVRSLADRTADLEREIEERRRIEAAHRQSEFRLRLLLEQVPAVQWTADADLRITSSGGKGLPSLGLRPGELVGRLLADVVGPLDPALDAHRRALAGESARYTGTYSGRHFESAVEPIRDPSGTVIGVMGVGFDRTERRAAEQTVQLLQEVNQRLASELEVDQLVQATTDIATQLSGAGFGAFLYNIRNEKGEPLLYALSKISREDFASLVLPTVAGSSASSAAGGGAVRSDVRSDARDPEKDSPGEEGCRRGIPVASSLEVPVMSRTGELLGRLVFGHPEPGRFTRDHERLVEGVAGYAAVAIENARLHRRSREELEERRRAERALRESDRRLQDALAGARMVAWEWEVEPNRWTATANVGEVYGLRPGQTLGDLEEVLRLLDPRDRSRHEESVRTAIARKKDYLSQFRLARPLDGRVIWLEERAHPILGKEGEVARLNGLVIDITLRKEAEEALAFLAEAGRALASSLDYDTTIQKVADLTVRQIADWCIVDMADGPRIRRVAVAHRNPDKVEWARSANKKYPPDPDDPGGVAGVLRTGKPVLTSVVTREMLRAGAKDEEHFRLLVEAGISSVMLVPLSVSGRTLGVLTCIASNPARRFDEADLALATALGERAALAAENAAHYRERLLQKERLDVLAESSRLFAESSRDLGDLMTHVAEIAVPSIADFCTVRRLSKDGRSIETIAVKHVDPDIEERERTMLSAPQPVDQGMTGDTLRTGKPVFLPELDPESFRRSTAARVQPYSGQTDLRSFMMVPMRARGLTLGVLALGRREAREPFSEADLDLVQKLADRVALALGTWDAFRLLEEEKQALAANREDLRRVKEELAREVADLTRLQEYSHRITGATGIEEAGQELLQSVLAIQGATLGFVQLVDPARNALVMASCQGHPPDAAERLGPAGLVEGDGAWGTAAARRETVIVEDVDTDPLTASVRDFSRWAGHRAMWSLPILGRRAELLGVLTTCYSVSRRPRERELRLVELYVAQAAQVIQAVRLYRQAQEELAERRRAEAASAFLGQVVRSSHDAVVTKTLEGRITSWNAAAERIFGYSAAEAVGQPITLIIPEDRHLEEKGILERLAAGGQIKSFETVRRRKDGSLLDVSITVSPVLDANGRVIGASKIARDITEQKRAQAEIRRLNDDLERRVRERTSSLEEMIRELDTFAYTVAHDLRAPIRAMQGFSDLLLEEYGPRLGSRGRDLAVRINKGGARMGLLINDLLAYSRLSREDIRTEEIDLGPLVDALLGTLESEIRAAGAEVRVHGSLPLVVGNRFLLVQAITNLVTNALKFVMSGRAPRILIRADEREETVRLWIEDNGIGIPPEDQSRLFRIFERLHSGERYPGTGIGLAIVRRAMERMGGAAGVDSTAGQGSRFWIALPAARRKLP